MLLSGKKSKRKNEYPHDEKKVEVEYERKKNHGYIREFFLNTTASGARLGRRQANAVDAETTLHTSLLVHTLSKPRLASILKVIAEVNAARTTHDLLERSVFLLARANAARLSERGPSSGAFALLSHVKERSTTACARKDAFRHIWRKERKENSLHASAGINGGAAQLGA